MACKGGTLQSGDTKYYPNAYYKVGDLFLTTNNENPSVRFGGEWELFGKGKTLVCVDADDDDFSTVKKNGGEKTHKLTVNEMPSHEHEIVYANNGKRINLDTGGSTYNMTWGTSGANSAGIIAKATGGNGAHNNLQPYITCYIWIRTK